MEYQEIGTLLKQADDILDPIENKDDKKVILLNMLLFRKAACEHEETQLNEPRQRPNPINTSNIKAYICSVLRMFAHELPMDRALLWLDPQQLSIHERILLTLYHLFRQIPSSDQAYDNADFINAFETIIRLYPASTISKSGSFFTPKSIVNLMVMLTDPKGGSIYDPCCKNAVTLLTAGQHLFKKNVEYKLFGQEQDLEVWKLAQTLLYFSNIKADLGKAAADVFMNDQHPHLQADVVLGNPPFSSRNWYKDNERIQHDPRWKYAVPTKNSGDFAWLQHMLYHTKNDGKLAAVLAVSALYRDTPSEHTIRKKMIEDDIIEAIIALPKRLFYGSQVATAIWIINKKKKKACQNCILFIDASTLGTKTTHIVTLPETDCEKIVSNYQRYINGATIEEEGFCKVALSDEIAASDYTLFPSHYISYEENTIPSILELDNQSQRLQSDLRDLAFANAALLDGLFKEK